MLSGDIWAKTKGSQEHSGVRGVLSRMARGDYEEEQGNQRMGPL